MKGMKSKMKCEVIRDLFPSYIDGLTSEESNRLIEEHLQDCKECREYLDEMKKEVETPKKVENTKKAIAPFKRIKRRMWRAAGLAVLVCVFLFGGSLWYFVHTWTADSEDVKTTIEAQGGIATIKFAPKNKNHRLYVEQGEDNTLVVTEQRIPPFQRSINPSAYWGYTFLDESTVMQTNGEGETFGDKDVLTIRYEDKTEQISLKELAKKAMENPVAQSEDVEMTFDKDQYGNVSLGFYPTLLGVSLKVEETGENSIRIRQYYDGEGETIENGDSYILRFVDEHTLQRTDGTQVELGQDDVLEIEYKDKTEKIPYAELWDGE